MSLITGYVAVIRNLIRRNMRCYNYFPLPRCGEPEKFITHAILECPLALQVWSLSATPTNPNIFPVSSIYANMDYLFWRKNNTIESELDRDPYSWIIWYIWKVRNDKLFRRIDRDPLGLVRYAESECQAQFNANEKVPPIIEDQSIEESQVLNLDNICMIDRSWTATTQRCEYVWKDNLGKIQLMGDTKLSTAKVCIAFRSGGTVMDHGEYASTFYLSELWNGL